MTHHFKYPRTLHLPQSQSVTSDDKMHRTLRQFEGIDVVITEKMDGENTTINSEGTHARSPDGRFHPSRAWMKQFASSISYKLSPHERICGEYLFARHSIPYENLQSYFYGFAWIVDDHIQSWKDTVNRFDDLGIISVPVLYEGAYFEKLIGDTIEKMDVSRQEGFVIRAASSFSLSDFSSYVGKFVRSNHVQTDTHWMYSEIIQNKLSI